MSSSPPPQAGPADCLIIPQLEPYHASSAAATFSEFAAAHTLAQLSAAASLPSPSRLVANHLEDASMPPAPAVEDTKVKSPPGPSDPAPPRQSSFVAETAASSATSPPSSNASGTRRKRRRPPKSYVVLIAEAILNSPMKCLSIREIYAAIATAYPTHYADPVDLGWQNTVRYNLSRHPAFVKVPHPPKYIGPTTSNRSSFWTISHEFMAQFERGNFVSAESLDPAGYPGHATATASIKKDLVDSDSTRRESLSSTRRRQRITSLCHNPAVPLPMPLSPVASPHTPVLAPVKTSSALAQPSAPLVFRQSPGSLIPTLSPPLLADHHDQLLGSLPTPTLSPSMPTFGGSSFSSASLFFPMRSSNASLGFQGAYSSRYPHQQQHIVSPLLMPSPAAPATVTDRRGWSATRELSPAGAPQDHEPSSPISSSSSPSPSPSQGRSAHKMSLSFLLSA